MACEVLDSPDGDMTKSKKLMDISLHDQGGEADIKWPDGRDLKFVIHTRAFTSPPDRQFPLFQIHDKRTWPCRLPMQSTMPSGMASILAGFTFGAR